MPTQRIPFAGSLMTRTTTLTGTRDQMFQNCFTYKVQDQMTGGGRIYTVKRPGFVDSTQTPSNVSTAATGGSCIWYGKSGQPVFVFVKTGGTSCGVYYYNGTQIGSDISTVSNCTFIGDTLISGTANLFAILPDSGTGANELWYFPDGGAWTQVTDSDFPSGIVGNAAEMDGYIFVLTTAGKLWNSDLNSIASWSQNNFISADYLADGAYAISRSKNYIITFGLSSIQFFVNNGNPTGSPLSVVKEASAQIGFKSTSSLPVAIGDDVYFSGVFGSSGASGIFRINGTQITKISTSEIDKLAQFGAFRCVGACNFFGFQQVLFQSLVSTSIMYAYEVDNNRWWKFFSKDSGETNSMLVTRIIGYDGTLTNYAIGTGITTSAYGTTTYTDYDSSIPTNFLYQMIIQTMPLDFGTDKYKSCKKLRLIGDKQASTCNVAVSWSDDDAVTFSTPVNIDMSSATNNYITGNMTRFKRRVFKFTNAVNLPLRLEAFEIEYDVAQW